MKENEKDLGKLIRTFSRLFKNCIRWEFEKKGLGEMTNPQILFIVGKHDEEFSTLIGNSPLNEPCVKKHITQKEIADEIGISAPTVAVSIKRMEKAGLLYRKSNQYDMRKNQLFLTEKGKKLVVQYLEEESRILTQLTKDFTDDEVIQMCEYYLRMIKNMEDLGARIPKLT